MASSEYFEKQADTCLRLSLVSGEEEVARRLLAMAEEYKVKARNARGKETSASVLRASRSPNEGDRG